LSPLSLWIMIEPIGGVSVWEKHRTVRDGRHKLSVLRTRSRFPAAATSRTDMKFLVTEEMERPLPHKMIYILEGSLPRSRALLWTWEFVGWWKMPPIGLPRHCNLA
jgi:hypothetical protein